MRSPFAAGAGLGMIGLSLLGWFTGMRGVMHALLITLVGVAPVPFFALLGLVALLAAAGLASAVLADAGTQPAAFERAAARGGWLSRTFYAQVRRQLRHPFAWGILSGLGLALVGIWLVLAALVVPLELGSLDLLLFSRLRIEAARGAEAAPATPDELLHPSTWKATEGGDAPVLDSFGRPVRFERDAGGAMVLRSLGLDATASADDLCTRSAAAAALTSVATPALASAAARDPLVYLERRRANQISWSEQVEALRLSRCTAH
jgi:hypothetical protein